MNWHDYLLPLLGVLCISGCGTTDVARYAAERPQLDLQQYFDGRVEAWGMFQDRSGEVIKRFKVIMDCHWQGNTGTLDEHFSYSDGTKQRRVWTLQKLADGRYTGTADDVVGTAQGHAAGNTLNWRYVMALPVNDKVYHVNFDDWMFLQEDGVMINRAVMSKFGFRLGEVTLSFRKLP